MKMPICSNPEIEGFERELYRNQHRSRTKLRSKHVCSQKSISQIQTVLVTWFLFIGFSDDFRRRYYAAD